MHNVTYVNCGRGHKPPSKKLEEDDDRCMKYTRFTKTLREKMKVKVQIISGEKEKDKCIKKYTEEIF